MEEIDIPSICFWAVDSRTRLTEAYVFPFPVTSAGESSVSPSTMVCDGGTLAPLSASYVSPKSPFAFTFLGSRLCILGSHVTSSLRQLDPACHLYSCFRDVAPADPRPHTIQYRPSCVYSRSREYDCPRRGVHFYVFDLSTPREGWIEAPSMSCCHGVKPYPIKCDGKIHVVGGDKAPVHEVFELEFGRWKSLPPPPPTWYEDTHGVTDLSAVVENPKRIIISTPFAKNFYAYDLYSERWTIIPLPTSKRQQRRFISGRAAVIEQTLYWIDYHKLKLVAFDLDKMMWLSGRVDFTFDSSSHLNPVLMHVRDDDLCLLWTTIKSDRVSDVNMDFDSDDSDYENITSSYLDVPAQTRTIINCAMIKVLKKIPHVKGSYGLTVVTKSHTTYVVDHPVESLDAFLM